jgi:hypothetical protein
MCSRTRTNAETFIHEIKRVRLNQTELEAGDDGEVFFFEIDDGEV